MPPSLPPSYNIHLGKGFYCNFNCVMLDCGPVRIGDRVLLGPAVQLYPGGSGGLGCSCTQAGWGLGAQGHWLGAAHA